MAEGGRKIVFLCSLLLFFHQMNCFLHIEELNEMKYGIEIQNTPVERTETLLPDVLYVASKYGQEYQCVLPKVSGQGEGEEAEEEENQQNLNISYLLAPMAKAPCLTKEKDWWTYEFCYGKNIRQYHLEEGEIKGDIYYIGFYESDKNWTNTSNEAAGSHRLQRYHSQKYVNGTTCDLTGHYRQAEVRFLCEEGMGDYINRVDEPSSCNYIITVHTTKICHHPYLRPLQSHKPQPIMCNPVLPHEQFVEYLRIQEESELRQKAKIAELKRKLQEKKAALEKEKEREEQKLKENLAKIEIDRRKETEMENRDGSAMNNLEPELEISRTPGTNEIPDGMVSMETEETEDNVVMETRSMDDMQKGEGLGRGSVKVAMATREDVDEDDEDDEDDDDAEVDIEKEGEKDEKEDDDIVESLELKELNKALRKLQKTLVEALEKGVKEAEDAGVEINMEDVDQKINSLNFADSVDSGDLRKVVKEAVQERLQKQKEPSQDAMGQESENDNTLRYTSQQEEDMADTTEDIDEDDVEEEEEEDEEEEDAEFVKEFEEELGSLKHKSRLSKMTEKVRQEMTKQFDDIIDEAEEELHSEEGTDPQVDRSDAARKLANTLNKLLEKMEKKSTAETKGEGGKVDALEEEEEDEEPPFTTPPPKQDLRSRDQVKVRVTKIQLGDKERLQENRGHDGISAQDRRKMEETVKEELEKAGMKTQGNIEVKIITTGYYGDDDDVHLLGDEETSYFREMIVTMLMGGEEALAEQRRQQQLEENYRFKFTPASKEVLSETENSRTETEDTDK